AGALLPGATSATACARTAVPLGHSAASGPALPCERPIGLEHGVHPVERAVGRAVVGPAMGAAALLARERRAGDERGERVRVVGETLQAVRVAFDAGVAPERLARRPRDGGLH